MALFLQMEVSWEMVKRDGFSMRAGLGGAALLNPGDLECYPYSSEAQAEVCANPPSLFPVVLFQVGTTF
jgi:hypothetical protein